MSNTIEILDKDTNTKQTYVLKDTPEASADAIAYTEVLISIFKKIISGLKFGLYLVISFIELFIKVMKVLFNLTDYKPFKSFTEARESILNKRASKQIDEYRIKFATEKLTRHQYEFERSKIYLDVYKNIQLTLKDFADNGVAINRETYKDILRKIDVLTVEVEKQALKEGYNYAAFTKYRLQDQDVYDDFIEYKIMRGEGNGKINKEQRESKD